MSRGQLRLLFLAEAAVLAVVGGALGILLGRLLANWTIALTATTVSTLYIASAAAAPALTPRDVVLAFATSVPLSLVAAVVPAHEAARVPPVAAIRQVDTYAPQQAARPRRLLASVILLGAAAWFATREAVHGLPIFGYAAAATVVLATSLLVPHVLVIVARALRPPARVIAPEASLAVGSIAASVHRIAISVAALGVSLAMTVAIAVMVGSFRETVAYWVSQTLQADLFVAPGARQHPGIEDTLSPDVLESIARSPDVAEVYRFRFIEVPFGETRVRVGGTDFAVLVARGNLVFKSPRDRSSALTAASAAGAAIVSESFSLKHRVRPGDLLDLPGATTPGRVRIAAIYYDYSTERGVIVMDRGLFEHHYGVLGASGASVYLRPGVDPEEARARLLTGFGPARNVVISTQSWLRREVLRVFDSTFAITYALEAVAIIVAMLGVAGTLLTLTLEREPELTTLRLLGATRGQLRAVLVAEAVIIGATAQLMGLLTGAVLSVILIHVINVQSFGWTIQFHVPAAFLVQSSLAVVGATALAALVPARIAGRLTLKQDV